MCNDFSKKKKKKISSLFHPFHDILFMKKKAAMAMACNAMHRKASPSWRCSLLRIYAHTRVIGVVFFFVRWPRHKDVDVHHPHIHKAENNQRFSLTYVVLLFIFSLFFRLSCNSFRIFRPARRQTI